MSIWASRLAIDGLLDDDAPGPIMYRGSHRLPRATDERGGSVDTAHIPGFIARDGYDDSTGGEDDPWWPYLRLSVTPAQRPTFEAWKRLRALADRLEPDEPQLAADVRLAADGEDTVILDLTQVDALITDLTAWRAGVTEDAR